MEDRQQFETEIASDTAPLNGLVEAMLSVSKEIHVLRGPTRGGVSSALTEIAQSANVGMLLDESKIPIAGEVRGACEIPGLDPLYVANEGKLIAIVPAAEADRVLSAMRGHDLGREAAIIGEVTGAHPGFVTMKTRVGGTRVVDMLSGEQLPRICQGHYSQSTCSGLRGSVPPVGETGGWHGGNCEAGRCVVRGV